MKRFSVARTWAVFIKEFQQMLRDRLTFAMAVGVPVMQLILFGYAINTDPKGLPTAIVSADAGPMARSLVTALQNTGYFKIVSQGTSQREADALLAGGDVQFMIVIPPDFRAIWCAARSRRFWSRSTRPTLLLRAMPLPPWGKWVRRRWCTT